MFQITDKETGIKWPAFWVEAVYKDPLPPFPKEGIPVKLPGDSVWTRPFKKRPFLYGRAGILRFCVGLVAFFALVFGLLAYFGR